MAINKESITSLEDLLAEAVVLANKNYDDKETYLLSLDERKILKKK